MTSISRLLEHPLALKLGLVLAHFLWQGVAVAALVLVALIALRQRQAAVRYLVFCALLLVMAASPVVTFFLLPSESPLPAVLAQLEAKLRPPIPESAPDTALTPPDSVSASLAQTTGSGPRARLGDLWRNIRPRLPWLAAGWAIGVVLLSLRLVLRWCSLLVIGRRASRLADGYWDRVVAGLSRHLRVRRAVRLLRSASIAAPLVMGWLRPVILLPPSVLTGLTPVQLEAVLAHELAHIRRHDYLANLVQTVIETVLFYHPAVWWLSRLIRQEREHCCDDLAVSVCGDAVVYARALAELEQLEQAPAAAVAATGGPLLARIWRLLGRSGPRRGRLYGWSLAGALAAGLVVLLLVLHVAATPALAAEACISYAASTDEPSRADVARFANVKTIRLAVHGGLDAQGEGVEEVRRVVTGLLRAARFRVVGEGPADAELITTVTLTPHPEVSLAVQGGVEPPPGSSTLCRTTVRMAGHDAATSEWTEEREMWPPGPAILPALRIAKEFARRSALDLLGRLAPDRYAELLGSPDPAIREAAFATLVLGDSRKGPLVRRAAAVITDRREDPAVRVAAAVSLSQATVAQPEARAALLSLLEDRRGEPYLRAGATVALAMLDADRPSGVHLLLGALSDRTPEVRWMAAAALGLIAPERERGGAASPAASALTAALDDPNPAVRRAAVWSLASIGPPAAALSRLRVLLTDEDQLTRADAACAIGRMGREGAPAVPALAALLRDRDADVRWKAAAALSDVGPAAKAALPALIAVLKDQREEDSLLQSEAAEALGSVGAPAVPALTAALRAPEASLRQGAASALGQIGAPAASAAPALVALMKDGEEGVRVDAVEALGQIGPAASTAVPALLAAARNRKDEPPDFAVMNSDLANFALVALMRCSPDDPRALDLALHVLRTADFAGRKAALEALGYTGPQAHRATAALLGTLRCAASKCRTDAADGLGKRPGPPPEEVLLALVAALDDRDERVRQHAAQALGMIGPAAIQAVPALRKLRQTDKYFPAVIDEALAKILGGRPAAAQVP